MGGPKSVSSDEEWALKKIGTRRRGPKSVPSDEEWALKKICDKKGGPQKCFV